MTAAEKKNFWGNNSRPGVKSFARPFEIRFWEKIDKRGPDECWPWMGALNQFGYGVISMHPENTTRVVTRVMYERAYGVELTREQLVCHTCDNPICVNYAHLWVGDGSANQQDCVAKGRHPTVGDKLTDQDVLDLRAGYVAGATVAELAKRYDINFKYAHAIVKGTVRLAATKGVKLARPRRSKRAPVDKCDAT